MDRIIRISFIEACLLLPGFASAVVRVYEGSSTSGTAIYTLDDGGRLHPGSSTSASPTHFLKGGKIYKGGSTSGTVLYTIDGNDRLHKGSGTSGAILYKFDRNKFYKGSSTSGSAIYNLSGKRLHEGPSTSGMARYSFSGDADIPLELLFLLVTIAENGPEGGPVVSRIHIYQGHYASGTPRFTYQDGGFYKGQYASGAPFYTLEGNRLYKGQYPSGAPEYVFDESGRLYQGQYPSGKAIFIYSQNQIYRGHYASGAADFTISGNRFYRGQYATGTATYAFDTNGGEIPDGVLFFLVAVIEPRPMPDVRPESSSVRLNDDEKAQICAMVRELTGETPETLPVRGTEETIRASLALGALPRILPGPIAVFNRPSVAITGLSPETGHLAIRVIPGEGGRLDPAFQALPRALHVIAADSPAGLDRPDAEGLVVRSAKRVETGSLSLEVEISAAKALFLKIRVVP